LSYEAFGYCNVLLVAIKFDAFTFLFSKVGITCPPFALYVNYRTML